MKPLLTDLQSAALRNLVLDRAPMADHRTHRSLLNNGWVVRVDNVPYIEITESGKDVLRSHLLAKRAKRDGQ